MGMTFSEVIPHLLKGGYAYRRYSATEMEFIKLDSFPLCPIRYAFCLTGTNPHSEIRYWESGFHLTREKLEGGWFVLDEKGEPCTTQ